MATTTSNLSLRKPESSDYVSVSLDIAGNMQTIDDKWASSAAANIGSAAAAGSALTVARTDHVHTVGSGTVSAPGLPVGESNTGLYRPGTGQLAATVAGALSWITSATGIALETAMSFKHIATPAAAATGYLKLYAKSDNKLYKQTPGGDEVLILDTDLFTTAGDMIYFTGDEVAARLAAGSTGQYLQGGSTPAWGSNLTPSGYVLPGAVSGTPAANVLHKENIVKAWAYVTVSGGTPTLAASYNISGITDSGIGQLTVSVDRDFASTSFAAIAMISYNSAGSTATSYNLQEQTAGRGTGAITLICTRASDGGVVDPDSYSVMFLGSQ